MKQDRITFTNFDGQEMPFTMIVDQVRGAYMTVSDVQRIFEQDFSKNIDKLLVGCSREYEEISGKLEELITIPMMIDCVYHTLDPDTGNLFNLLYRIERYFLTVSK